MTETTWRGELLVSHLAPPVREHTEAVTELEDLLAGLLDAGGRAHPDIDLPPERFLHHLADRLHDRESEPVATVLGSMPGADLYLAAACAAGDDRAIAALCDATFPPMRASLAKLGADSATIDETDQRLRIMLFVAEPEREPGICSYSGRGQLRSWIRSIGVRTCRRMMGAERHENAGPAADLDQIPIADHGPEISYLKEQYGAQFRAAFRQALTALTERERNILRQHYIDGLTIDQLGTLYRVHRATAARHVAGARRSLFDGTRERLVAELGIQSGEVDSIIRLVRSQLDISLHDFLG